MCLPLYALEQVDKHPKKLTEYICIRMCILQHMYRLYSPNISKNIQKETPLPDHQAQ